MTKVPPACSVVGCDRAAVARGWCLPHYKRWRRRGTTHDITPEERFFSYIQPVDQWDACWVWTNRLTVGGYGQFWVGKTTVLAHRWAYEFLRGEIPEGLHLDHLCSTPPCVNPWHLEPVTPRENVRRSRGVTAANARKTHCLRGHEFTAENTYNDSRGRRQCRLCARIRAKST